jgi:hypothetical protein
MDKYRLVMPPTLFAALAAPFWKFAHTVFFHNWYAATAAYCGGVFGYTLYDLTHYFLHHQKLPPWYQELKKYHLKHHFADYQNGFGVTSAVAWKDRGYDCIGSIGPALRFCKTTHDMIGGAPLAYGWTHFTIIYT